METAYFDPGTGDHVILDGNIIERNMLYLVEKIQDEYPDVRVLCVDPDLADSPFEEPFQICEIKPDGQIFKIFGCWELNDTVLERLRIADSTRIDVEKLVEETNEKVRKEQEKKFAEQSAARQDLVTSIVKNKKSAFTFTREEDDAKVKIFDDRPAEVKRAG